jgi:hypothetical protein
MAIFIANTVTEAGGSPIGIERAQSMIKHYIEQAKYRDFGKNRAGEVMVALAFGRPSLERALAGAAGLRIYFGLEPVGGRDMLKVILVGIDENDNDLGFNTDLTLMPGTQAEEDGIPGTDSSGISIGNTSGRAFLLERVLENRTDF